MRPESAALAPVIRALESRGDIQLIRSGSGIEAAKVILQAGFCVVLCFANTQEHIVQHVVLLKMLQSAINERRARVVMTSQFPENVTEIIHHKLKAYGIMELIQEPVPERSMSFKLDRIIKMQWEAAKRAKKDSARANAEHGGQGAEGHGVRRKEPGAAPAAAQPTVRMVDPLEIASDFWLVKGGSARRIAGRWMIQLRGPGPMAGRWTPIASEGSEQGAWQWVPTDAASGQWVREQGAWIFTGLRVPEFNEERWSFAGKNPALGFFRDGKSLGMKFLTDAEGTLRIAKDSATALSRVMEIQASWEKIVKKSLAADGDGAFQELEDRKEAADAMSPETGDDRSVGLEADEPVQTPELEDTDSIYGGKSKSKATQATAEMDDSTKAFAKNAGPAAEGDAYFSAEPSKSREINDRRSADAEQPREINDRIGEDPLPRDINDRRGAAEESEGGSEGDDASSGATAAPSSAARPKGPDEAEVKEPEFHYPIEFFASSGDWEYVFQDSNTKTKWYVFVPLELSNGVISHPSQLERFWTYGSGHLRPIVSDDQTEWIFLNERPQELEDFQDLPPQIRSYLIDRMPGRTQAARSEEVQELELAIQKNLADSGVELSSSAIEALAEAGAVAQAATQAYAAGGHSEKNLATGPDAVKSGDPSKPSLSPLAIAFLMAELLCKRDVTEAELASRYCSYVSSSCGGIEVELWHSRENDWVCASNSAGKEGRAGELVRANPESIQLSYEKGTLAIPVREKGRVLGLVVFLGDGVARLSQAHALAVARMATGLLISLSENRVSEKNAPNAA